MLDYRQARPRRKNKPLGKSLGKRRDASGRDGNARTLSGSRPKYAARPVRPLRREAAGWWPFLRSLPGRLPKLAFVAVVLWLALGLTVEGWAILRAPLRKISVTGNYTLSVERLVNQTGLGSGARLGEIDPYEIAVLLGQLPRVRTADVRRIFPRQLFILLQERAPTAVVQVSQSVVAVVDEEGMVLELGPPVLAAEHPALPRIRYGAEKPLFGQRLNGVQMRRAMQLLRDMASFDLGGGAPVVIDANDPFALTLVFKQARRRVILPPKDFANALGRYAAIAGMLSASPGKVEILDLRMTDPRYGGRIVVRR
ncbi:MAG: FtsQ-type POTRA domain-containing protein [SAR324 cluster bacterium]|nr:FtsQ-type POTRA domain-containing protein [SAR324 cluster bacterium]